jgi:hypothetical protein
VAQPHNCGTSQARRARVIDHHMMTTRGPRYQKVRVLNVNPRSGPPRKSDIARVRTIAAMRNAARLVRGVGATLGEGPLSRGPV